MLLTDATKVAKRFIEIVEKRGVKVHVSGDILREAAHVERITLVLVGTEIPDLPGIWIRGGNRIAKVRFQGAVVTVFRAAKAELGAMILHTTGSDKFSVRMRAIAKSKGYKLNQYGLWMGRRKLAGKTEESIFSFLKTDYVPPQARDRTRKTRVATARSSLGDKNYAIFHQKVGEQDVVICSCPGYWNHGYCWHGKAYHAHLEGKPAVHPDRPEKTLNLIVAAQAA
jgi:hypothetical protein